MALTGTTDATGQVTIAVPAGKYTVTDVPPAGYTAAPAQTVDVTAGTEVPVSFVVQAPAGSLRCTVVDQTGRVLSGVLISVA